MSVSGYGGAEELNETLTSPPQQNMAFIKRKSPTLMLRSSSDYLIVSDNEFSDYHLNHVSVKTLIAIELKSSNDFCLLCILYCISYQLGHKNTLVENCLDKYSF